MTWRTEIYPAADTGSEKNLNPLNLFKSHCVASIRFLVKTWRLSRCGRKLHHFIFFSLCWELCLWLHREALDPSAVLRKRRSYSQERAPSMIATASKAGLRSSINIHNERCQARKAAIAKTRPVRCVRWCRNVAGIWMVGGPGAPYSISSLSEDRRALLRSMARVMAPNEYWGRACTWSQMGRVRGSRLGDERLSYGSCAVIKLKKLSDEKP